jgi:hydroxymethylbilane synthase
MRVATRGSELALLQTQLVNSLLGIEAEVVVVRTTGEVKAEMPIHEIGGQGVFVKELQQAVLDGRADFAVHSAKDLPAETPPGLVIAAVPRRGEVRDALVGKTLNDIPNGGLVGTGSVRRRAQLLALRPDLKFGELRGNIGTRIKKAANFDAIVLAAVALERLNLDENIAEMLSVEMLLPQVAQGALAVECRADDDELIKKLQKIEHESSRMAIDAERSFLLELGGACDYPEGALATVDAGGVISLTGLISSLDGSTVLRYSASGSDAQKLGIEVAQYLLNDAGGKKILDALSSK